MDLLVTTFGSRIRRQREQIVVEIPNEETRRYSARRLERILIAGKSSISSDAIRLALQHGVDVSFLGQFGKPEARLVPASPTGATKVRHAQFRAALMGGAFWYARQFVFGKIKNQIAFAECVERDSGSVLAMQEALRRAEDAGDVGSLMSAEGRAADVYFSGVWRQTMNGAGRDQGGKDPVNAALNYGYGVLYNEVERALLHVGLDPYVGMLHSERYGKPSLTLDFIEEFRVPCVDAVLLPLFARGLFAPRDTTPSEGKVLLSTYGRHKILRELFANLNEIVAWQSAERHLKGVITEQAHALARSLQLETPSYQPFVAPVSFYEKCLSSHRHLVDEPQSAAAC